MFAFRLLWLTCLPGAILGPAGPASAQVVFLDLPGRCAGVPDTDGDGAGDVIVGASNEDLGPPYPGSSGAAYLFSGASGALLHRIISPMPAFYGAFGHSVAGIEDLDGDGRGEVIIGAYGEARAYVFSGASGDLIRILTYSQGGAHFGLSVSALPDADGDGFDDIAVGAPAALGESGLVYVFSGATGVELHRLASPTPASGGLFGHVVAGVPDADGDGAGDIVIGSRYLHSVPPDWGRAYLYSGATGLHLHTLDSPVHPAWYFGSESVAGLADINGDGRGDVAIGARMHDAGPIPRAGLTYVFSGADGTLLYTLMSPRAQQSAYFGHPLVGVPDLDGDGGPELLIGASGEWDIPGDRNYDAGSAYLFSGAGGALLRMFDPPAPQRNGGLGFTLAAVPDANHDGRFDLAIGSFDCPDQCPPRQRGRIYLHLSCAPDFNASGSLDSQDFFDFVRAYFTAAPGADFDRSGTTDSSDFFSFLGAFFQGCP